MHRVVTAADAHLPRGGIVTLQAKCFLSKLKLPLVYHIHVGATVVLPLHLGQVLTVCVTVTVPLLQGEITVCLASPSFVNLNQLLL